MKAMIRVVRDQGGAARLFRLIRGNPAKAARAAMRIGLSRWRRTLLGDPEIWRIYSEELAATGLLDTLEKRLTAAFSGLDGKTARGNPFVPGHMHRMHAEVLYVLTRHRSPEVIIETGVCNGFSTAVLLTALERNGKGRLLSVDLPEFSSEERNNGAFWQGKAGAVVPGERPVGWLVADDLKERWELHLGPAKDVLPAVLAGEHGVDIFIHDSEHSYQNQIFEFRAAFPRLAPGGLLVATDIGWSGAFDDFWSEVRPNARRTFVDHSMAVIVKR